MTRPAARRLSALVLSIGLVSSLAGPVAAVDGATYVSLANQKRASVGLGPVSIHAAVDQVAVERANQMAANDDFRHDLNYIVARLQQMGVCFTGYGEIIAWERGYPTYDPARTIEQWWASPGHHAIIVGDYTHAGGSHTTSSATSKIYSAMVFVKLCAGSAPPPAPPSDTDNTTIARLAGGDRYATAAAISRARYTGGARTVFVATGTSFPDALAGSPAAAVADGPILLTAPTGLPAATAAELTRLRPSRIVVLGGPGAVGEGVVAQLRAHAGSVERWWGANRFETAAAIARHSFAPGIDIVYVATARSFPDALSGGAVAGLTRGPILLVERDSVPAATASALADLRPRSIVVLGGTGVVSDAVARALGGFARSGSVQRLAGADRFATSVAISRSAYGSAGSEAAFVATGSSFPDGLAGGPLAALVPGPLLLVAPTRLPAEVAAELQRLTPDRVFVLGGTGAVSDGVVGAIDAALP